MGCGDLAQITDATAWPETYNGGRRGGEMGPEDIAILIAEDHALVREGTRRILEQAGFSVVAEAADGVTAVELASRTHPHVALLDLRLPALNGIAAAQEILRASPLTRVVILSAYDDDDYVMAAVEAGVAGYLLKTAPGDALVEAVKSVCLGELVLDPAIARKVRKLLAHVASASQAHGQLTAREQQVLALAAKGMRNKEIARQLDISVRTVEDHMAHIFEKLGVTSRTEAVMRALARGWLFVPENGPSP